ncbi:putative platelet-activating factor acetylhydrolase 2 [Venustampulla echinocandica]|uniref:Putative phospholipase n=1 Tax=Venustampulla echinocandica TaxID=2656787 RepID=A0A370TT68_9HELO|nr:putative platelet-activating factor acetylhydrolase 2 [Venustampulla echinocandica]RDL38688.1 putative platelet-activating factor acetylhydrolase 2 [Venustampulla echinocandica]
MTSYFSYFSPVPAFPSYTGPYVVGSIDVEIPVAELESPSPAPDESISTIQYRIFYPCEPESSSKAQTVNWVPVPQRSHLSAFSRFAGAGSVLAEFVSFIPRLLHYIQIPVHKNAPLRQPDTSTSRWPVMIFSHGLGGSRNAYSQIIGSIASHGMIVIAPEHRDGSTPVSYIRAVPSTETTTEKVDPQVGKKVVDYVRISHTPSPEVEQQRNAQLRTRLWEMGLVHDSLIKLDNGMSLTNLNSSSITLSPFKDKMDVHTPGKITFAGHSFGGATVTQLVKSTFYSPLTSSAPASYTPLFTPSSRSSIAEQITPQTPLILLDVWCFPLRAESTRWLWDKPFPCYSTGGPGGAALLAVESQAFFKWREHLQATKRLLSPDPSSTSPHQNFNDSEGREIPTPNFYYAASSAHLSQSDFGILFPWFTKRFMAVQEPERIMRLNVRAVLQTLRNCGIEVSKTSHADMELEDDKAATTDDDTAILSSELRGWNFISTDLSEGEAEASKLMGKTPSSVDPSDAVIRNEVLENRKGKEVTT